jgi:hypothetical protein
VFAPPFRVTARHPTPRLLGGHMPPGADRHHPAAPFLRRGAGRGQRTGAHGVGGGTGPRRGGECVGGAPRKEVYRRSHWSRLQLTGGKRPWGSEYENGSGG